MITKFGKRFLTSHLAGLVDFTTKDLALGIGSNAVNQLGNDTRLQFEFYRLPATLSSIDIRSADITGLSASGSAVTYTAQNNFSPGQTIKITGVVPTQYNVSSALVTSASNSQFTIASSSTISFLDLIILNEAAIITIAKSPIKRIDFVTTKLPIEKTSSGIKGTRKYLVR